MSSERQPDEYEVAVIGAGSGGYAAARTAAAAGLRTVVIEGGQEVGGLCILRGCMPTKALLYAAEVRHLSRQGGLWGLQPGQVKFDRCSPRSMSGTLTRAVSGRRPGSVAGR